MLSPSSDTAYMSCANRSAELLKLKVEQMVSIPFFELSESLSNLSPGTPTNNDHSSPSLLMFTSLPQKSPYVVEFMDTPAVATVTVTPLLLVVESNFFEPWVNHMFIILVFKRECSLSLESPIQKSVPFCAATISCSILKRRYLSSPFLYE